MIFPVGDTQVKGGFKPIFAYSFIALNVIVFGLQLMTSGNLICEFSVIPSEIRSGIDLHTMVTSMFLHGGLEHIVYNLLFLWIFADNIEATVGSVKFVIFYLLGGIAASLLHVYIDGFGDIAGCCNPCKGCEEGVKLCNSLIPSLGASGAISSVMGAYMVMFPKSQIKILVIFLFRNFNISAWVFLAIWFGQQLFAGFESTMSVQSAGGDGVAWWAHIGGFAFGLLAGFYFKNLVPKNTESSHEGIV